MSSDYQSRGFRMAEWKQIFEKIVFYYILRIRYINQFSNIKSSYIFSSLIELRFDNNQKYCLFF